MRLASCLFQPFKLLLLCQGLACLQLASTDAAASLTTTTSSTQLVTKDTTIISMACMACAGAPPGPAPYYCRKWRGVSCDEANQVSSLDLSALLKPGVMPPFTEFSEDIGALLANITGLQVGVCQLHGSSSETPGVSTRSGLYAYMWQA